ncbi:hypothetical protein LNQ03_22775 [Klebsiella pneumoniae subsp. pneumoniae]|nr:hypothetical protein [Klebsiella pneumoniae subsp. pneumoniae]
MLEALDTAVIAGKARAIGISNCYAWQLAKRERPCRTRRADILCFCAEPLSEPDYAEDERELFGLCTAEEGIAMTPYSARWPAAVSSCVEGQHAASGGR